MQLTKTQEGILNAEAVAGGAISNICGATFFPCRYSVEDLNNAVNTVVRINDAFRLHFDYKTKEQWVDDYIWRDYEVLYFDDYTSFESFAEEYARTRLDPSGPLFDLKIVMIGNASGLIYVLHHVICDAWSFSVLRWQLHRILEDGVVPEAYSFLKLCEEEQAYFDSRRFEKDRLFFLEQFREKKDKYMAPELHIGDYRSKSLSLEIPHEIAKGISAYVKKANISVFVLLLSAFGICYGRINENAGCFYLGTTILNRASERSLNTIGPLIDDIPLLFSIDYGKSAGDTVRQVEERVMDSFRHHRFNYPMMQEAIRGDVSNVRLYDVIFNYQAEYEIVDEYQVKWYQNGIQCEPLQIHVDHRNDRNKFTVTYNYHTEKFTENYIQRLHGHFMNVLQAVISDDKRITGDISVMDEAETAEIMKCSHGKDVMIPDKALYQIIEDRQKGKIIEGDTEYSIRALLYDAEKIDAAIRGKKRVIAIICDRSYPELAAIYGIIRGGNAYLPISPEYPVERIRTILRVSGCDTVLAQRKYKKLYDSPLIIEDILESCVPIPDLPVAASPNDTLYVIFTSGSTGTPKGAVISNRSAVNRIIWMTERYFTDESTIMLKTPYTFDVSVWEIFGFALSGSTLYILPPEDHYRQDRIIDHIRKGKVTDIHFVPTVFRHFLAELEKDGGEILTLKNIFLSGEKLSAELLKTAPAIVHNLYGPTECAVDVTYHDCVAADNDPIPIGRPVSNCDVFILNHNLELVPMGIRGQICIGGIPVGKGYINDPERTSEAFVPNPYGNGMLYLTGDIGYWDDDMEIVFAGRNDRQVKINGQRIELEEIEAVLSGFSDQVAVMVEGDRIIAYYSGEKDSLLREKASAVLPRYMVPHSFIHVPDMPLTTSGKIDRKALTGTSHIEQKYEPPANRMEERICTVFADILHKERVGRNDDFYDLGGTSLDMIEMLCTDPLDRLSPSVFMTHPTPEKLAEALNANRNDGPLVTLYTPNSKYDSGIVLFSYAGGDAAAYTRLVKEFRDRNALVALYFIPWLRDYDSAEAQIRRLSDAVTLSFYSHCAGAVTAMKLIDRLNAEDTIIRKYIAAANIPPGDSRNPWVSITDKDLINVLYMAGMPPLTEYQEKDLAERFRSNTDEYFDYLRDHVLRTPCTVSLILSKNDLFTGNYQSAKELWEQYVMCVDSIEYIQTPSHYFQSTDARKIADILLMEAE